MKKLFLDYLLIRFFIGVVLWIYFRIIHRKQVQVIGKENIPKEGNILIYSNHPSMMDPLLILGIGFFPQIISNPKRLPFTLAAEENFLPKNCRKITFIKNLPVIRDLPILRVIARPCIIPVKEGRNDPIALKIAIKTLREKNILIFPEGGRTKKHPIDNFEEGIASIIYNAKPHYILPVRIKGVEKILPKGQNWPDWKNAKIEIIFGKPLTINDFHLKFQSLRELFSGKEGRIKDRLIYKPIAEMLRNILIKM